MGIAIITYITVGVVLTVLFYLGLIKRLDSAAYPGSIGFRVAIFPGLVALWPIMVLRSTPDSLDQKFSRQMGKISESQGPWIFALTLAAMLTLGIALCWRSNRIDPAPPTPLEAR